MPPIRTPDRPRQDPVSCQLCRTKKLKCDRLSPCSNCTSRRLTCEYRGEKPPLNANNVNHSREDELRADNRAITARLERLEQVVFNAPSSVHSSSPALRPPPVTAKIAPRARTDAIEADEDSHWLESVGARADTILPHFRDRVVLRFQTLEQSLTTEQPSELRTISMPTYEVAVLFLNAYADHLDSMQHILHIESTRNALDRLYSNAASGHEVDPGAMCLILGICACVAFYWTVGSSCGDALFDKSEPAHKVSSIWARQSLYAMEQIHLATTDHTLEAVQSMVMLMFLFYHMEGFTARVKLMHSSSIALAHTLGLHKTDSPRRPAPKTQADVIDHEVRRKLWWHLTCTDWILSFMGGPQEGTYNLNTQNMIVNLPRNLNRDDLSTEGPDFARLPSEPTMMSYYLQRIKLAAICRDITDNLWHSIHFTGPDDVERGTVAALDAKFDLQLQELPFFMRLDVPVEQLRAEYGEVRASSLEIQRIMIHLMLNTRRCKLHMPFLVRVKTNPQFQQFRATGLQAARAVFETRRYAMRDQMSFGANHLKLGGILQHIFFATIVLVMDLCINGDEKNGAALSEVQEGLQVMEDARDSSPMSRRFHESLLNVLRKHNVYLPSVDAAPPTNGSNTIIPPTQDASVDAISHDLDVPSTDFETDGMWQDFLNSVPTLQPQEWDALISDLDMQPM